MKCALCNGTVKKKKGVFNFDSLLIGKIEVPGIEFEQCLRCGDILLSSDSNKKVIAYVKRKEQEAINDLPIGGFVSLNEAASILGITKQAFSKNPKIKKGLIICKKLGRYTYYLEKSVRLFKRKGNGKFLLPNFTKLNFSMSVFANEYSESDQKTWSVASESERVYTPSAERSQLIKTYEVRQFRESDRPQTTRYKKMGVLDETALIH